MSALQELEMTDGRKTAASYLSFLMTCVLSGEPLSDEEQEAVHKLIVELRK